MKKLFILILFTVIVFGCSKENPVAGNNIYTFYLQKQNVNQDMNALYPCKMNGANEVGINISYPYKIDEIYINYGGSEYELFPILSDNPYNKNTQLFVGIDCDQINVVTVKAYKENIGMEVVSKLNLGHIIIDKPLTVNVHLINCE
jgi:hypothetical protein